MGHFWSFLRKFKIYFSTVCRRLVRGIKEGWSVIDIARLNFWISDFSSQEIGPIFSGLVRREIFSPGIQPNKVLLCCLGWDDEENCGNFIFTRKGWSISFEYSFKTVNCCLRSITVIIRYRRYGLTPSNFNQPFT